MKIIQLEYMYGERPTSELCIPTLYLPYVTNLSTTSTYPLSRFLVACTFRYTYLPKVSLTCT